MRRTKKDLNRTAANLRETMRRALRKARDLHARALFMFDTQSLDGGKMRSLDDVVQWMEDATKELSAFLRTEKT
jgi:hypothetical protein